MLIPSTCESLVQYKFSLVQRNTQTDETNEGHVEFHGRDNFRINSFLPILDAIKTDLEHRYQEYQAIFKKYGVLL